MSREIEKHPEKALDRAMAKPHSTPSEPEEHETESAVSEIQDIMSSKDPAFVALEAAGKKVQALMQDVRASKADVQAAVDEYEKLHAQVHGERIEGVGLASPKVIRDDQPYKPRAAAVPVIDDGADVESDAPDVTTKEFDEMDATLEGDGESDDEEDEEALLESDTTPPQTDKAEQTRSTLSAEEQEKLIELKKGELRTKHAKEVIEEMKEALVKMPADATDEIKRSTMGFIEKKHTDRYLAEVEEFTDQLRLQNGSGKKLEEKIKLPSMMKAGETGMFYQDLTAHALNGRYDHLEIDEDVMVSIIENLLKEKTRSCVVTGPQGSGKTSAVYAAIRAISQGKIPEKLPEPLKAKLKKLRFIGIKSSELAGNVYVNSGQQYVKAMVDDCARKDIVVVIDEMHGMFEQDVAFNDMKDELENGDLVMIGMATNDGWDKVVAEKLSGDEEGAALNERIGDRIFVEYEPEKHWAYVRSWMREKKIKHGLKFEKGLLAQLRKDYPKPQARQITSLLDKVRVRAQLSGSSTLTLDTYKKVRAQVTKRSERENAASRRGKLKGALEALAETVKA